MVRWHGGPHHKQLEQVCFRLVSGYTFGQLLKDALLHFDLLSPTVLPQGEDESAGPSKLVRFFELRDLADAVWPLQGCIEKELAAQDFAPSPSEQQQQQQLDMPVVRLVELPRRFSNRMSSLVRRLRLAPPTHT